MLDAAPDAGHSSEESARSLLLGSCSRAAGGGAAQVRVWHGQGREGHAGWQEGGGGSGQAGGGSYFFRSLSFFKLLPDAIKHWFW